MRKAEAKLKRQREREVKEAEKDAAEMADLMANDPEVSSVEILLLTLPNKRPTTCVFRRSGLFISSESSGRTY